MSKYEENIIKLSEYKKDALATAFYPNFGNNILYPIIAVFEESGELLEKLDEGAKPKDIAKELGDVLWYSAMVFHEINEDFEFTIQKEYMTTDKLMMHNSRIAGIIKKSQRDDNGELNGEKRQLLMMHLNYILTFVYNVATQIGFTIEDVCDMNIRKIEDRINRGQLSGSGDDR